MTQLFPLAIAVILLFGIILVSIRSLALRSQHGIVSSEPIIIALAVIFGVLATGLSLYIANAVLALLT